MSRFSLQEAGEEFQTIPRKKFRLRCASPQIATQVCAKKKETGLRVHRHVGYFVACRAKGLLCSSAAACRLARNGSAPSLRGGLCVVNYAEDLDIESVIFNFPSYPVARGTYAPQETKAMKVVFRSNYPSVKYGKFPKTVRYSTSEIPFVGDLKSIFRIVHCRIRERCGNAEISKRCFSKALHSLDLTPLCTESIFRRWRISRAPADCRAAAPTGCRRQCPQWNAGFPRSR